MTTASTIPAKATTRQWAALAALMIPVLLVSIDNTVLSFALPEISRSLHPTGTQLLWIVDAYPLILAGLLVAMGSLGDRVGRRKLLLIGAIGFGAVSLYAAFSTTPEHLITARALQGLFGATLMPSTLALLRNIFLDDVQRRLAIAIWASGFSAGAALGPIVGGWLLEHYWWGSVFLINAPVLAVLLIAAPLLIPESRDPKPGALDITSMVASVATMFTIVYGIKAAATGDALVAITAILTGSAIGWWFVRRQNRLTSPMLDMALFRNRLFSASVLTNLMAVVAMTGMLFYVAQYVQLVLGYSPFQSGLILLPGLVATVIAGLVAVRLSLHFPLRVLIPTGLALSASGFAVATQLGANTSVWLLIAAFALVGLGLGLAETLTNDAILGSVPPHKAGAASGISETAYELGALLGTAILGSILTAVYRTQFVIPPGVSDTDADAARQTLGGAVDTAATLPDPLGTELLTHAKEAFALGADTTSFVGLLITATAATMMAIVLRTHKGLAGTPH